MHTQIYINLPVRDLPRSCEFFAALGYAFEPNFSSEQGACLILGPNLYAMLLTHEFFKGFTDKPLVDAKQAVEVLVCLNCASREAVDTLVAKALAAGGTVPRAAIDRGFMYAHSYEDLDGHIWELMHMDASAAANETMDA